MLLRYRDVSSLRGPWYVLELLSESTVEMTLRRICQSIPGVFQRSAVLLFIPMDYREGAQVRGGSYVYLRSDNFSALARLKRIRGVVGLVTNGNSSNPRHAIRIEPAEVDRMIEKAQRDYAQRVSLIRRGCRVRVIDGVMKNYRGKVAVIRADRATVVIRTETRLLRLETSRGNLLLDDAVGDPFGNAGRPENPQGQK